MYMSSDVDVGTGGSWAELPVQRRLCLIFISGVMLPDIHEYSHGLTGCQQTLGFWGVTAWYQSLGTRVPRAWGNLGLGHGHEV